MADDTARFSHTYEYTALVPIDIDGVRAFNPGDGVPAGHVTDLSLEVGGQVVKAGTAKDTRLAATDPPAGKV